MPSKRRLITSEICFGTEKAGHLDFSYNKCALDHVQSSEFALVTKKLFPWIHSCLNCALVSLKNTLNASNNVRSLSKKQQKG